MDRGIRTVLVTGSKGFIGKNLLVSLRRRDNLNIREFDLENTPQQMKSILKEADFIYHLAGVNRPKDEREFHEVNTGLTRKIVDILKQQKKKTPIVFPSSIQADLNNPYGISKKEAEDVLIEYSKATGARIYLFRLPNVFGKWCRPNYNSVVATFCHNIARDLDIRIDNENKQIELVYIDDVIRNFVELLDKNDIDRGSYYYDVDETFRITVGELAKKIYELRDIRKTLIVPDLADRITRYLYATYLSYLDPNDFSYGLEINIDARGSLVELLKSRHFGQIFMSTSKKGVTRGNHFHHTKVEKFCVIKGKAVIMMRNILDEEVFSYYVSDERIEIVDIPPGYTHSIENLSDDEFIVIFWAGEIFDPDNPDTFYSEVEL